MLWNGIQNGYMFWCFFVKHEYVICLLFLYTLAVESMFPSNRLFRWLANSIVGNAEVYLWAMCLVF